MTAGRGLQVYARLGEKIGVDTHLVVLNIMVQKIAINLNQFSHCEDVVTHTLALFQVYPPPPPPTSNTTQPPIQHTHFPVHYFLTCASACFPAHLMPSLLRLSLSPLHSPEQRKSSSGMRRHASRACRQSRAPGPPSVSTRHGI